MSRPQMRRAWLRMLLSSVGGAMVLSSCSSTGSNYPGPTASPPARLSIPVGASNQSISVGGVARMFIVYKPADVSVPAPLVVMLHGGYGSASQAERSYGWDAEAATGHFVVIYPNGLNHAWNTGGGCCGDPAKDDVNDVGFIVAAVKAIESSITIDPARVFATGISNGGIMDYTLACKTDIFDAIGPDSATQLGSCSHPDQLSVIHIHGTADTRIPYDGGRGQGEAHIDGPSIPDLNATWRDIDDCSQPTVTATGAVTTSIATCPNGRSVELVTIAGAGHQWPGGVDRPIVQKILGTDPPSTALDATQVIWQFFASHPGVG